MCPRGAPESTKQLIYNQLPQSGSEVIKAFREKKVICCHLQTFSPCLLPFAVQLVLFSQARGTSISLKLTGSPSTTSPLVFRMTMTSWAWKVIISTGPWSIIFPMASWKTKTKENLTAPSRWCCRLDGAMAYEKISSVLGCWPWRETSKLTGQTVTTSF